MRTICFLLSCLLILVSCNGGETKQQQRQKEIEKISNEINTNPVLLKEETANKILNLYNSYIKDYPQDTICEYYLFQMHNVYTAMRQCDSALYCLDRIITEYPKGKNVGAAYFFKGIVLNDVCHNREKSIEAFEEYIRRYPDNPHVYDAKRMIQMDTMKNPLELIQPQTPTEDAK
ncbi:MAG: tetratricopeptide repeat protein [Bacteroidales bacterium]|nr:tetratricopeptide repeat protein [Bacteroidales bacterium]